MVYPVSSISNNSYASQEDVPSSSQTTNAHLVSDEVLARQMQMFYDMIPNSSLEELSGTEADINAVDSSTEGGANPTNTSAQVTEQDNVDPDNMSYEQLQNLEEEMGSESRGLSNELINYLKTSKYKSAYGFFSKKKELEECVICKSSYKNRQKLIHLPCEHYYHSGCIAVWLKMNKACPICKDEVFG